MQTNKTAVLIDSPDYSAVFEAELEQTKLTHSSDVPTDIQPGDFGYYTYVVQPQMVRALCKDADQIPSGSWGIELFDDGHAKSWMTRSGAQFSERGRQWWESVNEAHEERLAVQIEELKLARIEAAAQAKAEARDSAGGGYYIDRYGWLQRA